MLVLGRNRGEKVMIGADVCIHILDIHGKNVRLGFEAPDNVEIHRLEIFEKVKAQNIANGSIEGNLTTKKVAVIRKSKAKVVPIRK